MEVVNSWLKVLQQWATYFSYCIEQPIQAPVCKPFWTWAMVGLFAIGVLTAVVIVWKIVSYKFKLAAALRAQAERDRVDHDAIEAGKWDGDKAYSAELGGARKSSGASAKWSTGGISTLPARRTG